MRSLSCFIQLDLLAKSGSIHRLYCRNSHFIKIKINMGVLEKRGSCLWLLMSPEGVLINICCFSAK